NGTFLVAGGGEGVRVWEAATGKTRCLGASRGRIVATAIAPDGRTMAAGGLDGMIHLWDLDAKVPLREFRGHEQDVYGLGFSPNGQTLVSGGTDRTLRLWKVATGEECGRLELDASETSHPIIRPITFFPDNRTIATQNYGDKRLRLWDAVTGKELHRLDWLPQPLSAVALAPDGTVVAAAVKEQPTVRLWQVASGQELLQLHGHRDGVDALAFSVDGLTLASAGLDGTIRLWQVDTGVEVGQVRTDQAGA